MTAVILKFERRKKPDPAADFVKIWLNWHVAYWRMWGWM
jgi:hypothetical protein